MRTGWIFAAAALLLLAPVEARAFECPGHIAEARAMIDKVNGEIAGMKGRMTGDSADMVHSLLDYAEMYLAGARHNHEKPQGAYDHARAIAKADSARSYAAAAGMLLAR